MATFRKRGEYQWQAIVRKRGYPPTSKTFNSRREAEAWASVIESEIARGVFVSRTEAESTTLAEALERYWRESRSKMANAHRDIYQHRRWLTHPLSTRFLANIRGTDLAKYRDDRRRGGKAENTIRIELAYLSQLFEVCRKEWGIEGLPNPVRNIRMPAGSYERDRRLRPGEFELLLSELTKSDNPWVRPAFELAIETSLRQGMLFKLRWGWVDLGARTISIPPQFRGTGNKSVPAAIPLSTKAVEILHLLPKSMGGLILPCSQNSVVCVWKRTVKRLKLHDLRWHDLRHEAASRLFEKGVDVHVKLTRDFHRILTHPFYA